MEGKKGHPFLSSQIYTIMFLTIILLHQLPLGLLTYVSLEKQEAKAIRNSRPGLARILNRIQTLIQTHAEAVVKNLRSWGQSCSWRAKGTMLGRHPGGILVIIWTRQDLQNQILSSSTLYFKCWHSGFKRESFILSEVNA